MTNPENIIPPKPGEVRNPKGKPKGTKNRATLLRKWLEVSTKLKNPVTGKDQQGTVEEQVALALISRALKGDIQAIKEVNDTMYGKIPDKSEVKAEGDITIKLIKGDRG